MAAVAVTGAQSQEGFRFKSGVDFVNVTATVTDGDGRFVSGLRQEDFTVYEDGQVQDVSHFSSDRVPVSLGIALDTSGSMTPEKLAAARAAIERLIFKLLDPERRAVLRRVRHTRGGHAGLDDRPTVDQPGAEQSRMPSAAPRSTTPSPRRFRLAEEGRNRKKALLVISDGNDTNSTIGVSALRQRIRESEVLVYALGVDSTSKDTPRVIQPPVQFPPSIPFPFPGGDAGSRAIRRSAAAAAHWPRSPGERVNADALRQITDDTGGRTEIVPRLRGSRWRNGAHRRRVEQAVLPRVHQLGQQGRPLALDSRDGARPQPDCPRTKRLRRLVTPRRDEDRRTAAVI